MEIVIKKFDELSSSELYEILKARAEVFVLEQNCPYNDVDGKDYKSTHIVVKKDDVIAAYIRSIPAGVSYETASFGRVLVSKKFRGEGLAKLIVEAAIKQLFEIEKVEAITIGAQHYLEKFYSSFGFKTISEIYLEDDIPHVDMILFKKN